VSAGGITQAGIGYLLDLLRNAVAPAPTYYVALVAQLPPGFTIGGEELDEPDFAEYARAEIVNDSASWEITDNVMSNTGEVTFPTAGAEWGQVSYWAICDQPQSLGGSVLWCGQFSEPLWVEDGQQVYLNPGELGLPISGNQWLMR
jgi:hypothetical protein